MSQISVIIPYFENHDRLERCVDAIHTQLRRDYEILIYDDASPTHRYLQAISGPSIKIHYSSQNRGPSVWRNRGIEDASGDYILFQDSDDIVLSDPRQMLLGADGPDIAVGRKKGEAPYPLMDFDLPRRVSFASDPVLAKKTAFTANLYRRDFLMQETIRFPADMHVGEDTLFLAEAFAKSANTWLTRYEIFDYVARPDSLMADRLTDVGLRCAFDLLPERLMAVLDAFPAAKGIRTHSYISRRLQQLKSLTHSTQMKDFDHYCARLATFIVQYWDPDSSADVMARYNMTWPKETSALIQRLSRGPEDSIAIIRQYLANQS